MSLSFGGQYLHQLILMVFKLKKMEKKTSVLEIFAKLC